MLDAMDETPRFLSGKLLLAMPGIGDPRVERAVIALCVHDENGAVGIGIGHQRAGIGVRGDASIDGALASAAGSEPGAESVEAAEKFKVLVQGSEPRAVRR